MRRIIKISVLFILVFPVFAKAQNAFNTHYEVIRYFNKNIRYPDDALDNCKSGYVLLKFEVDSAGNVSGVEKMFGEHMVLVDEVRRVLARTNGLWSNLFKKSGTGFLPLYFTLQDMKCDSVRPASVRDENSWRSSISPVTGKPVEIQNGLMLTPIVVVGYPPIHRRVQTKNSSD